MEQKIKILWWSEFFANTGFSKVSEAIVGRLTKTGKYDITVLAIGYSGDPYDREKWPITIYNAVRFDHSSLMVNQDILGRQRLLDLLKTGEYDVLVNIHDLTTLVKDEFPKAIDGARKSLKEAGMKMFRWISYFPVDSEYAREHWVTNGLNYVDCPVAYTEFGKKCIQAITALKVPEVIPHGIDTKEFYPLPPSEVAEAKEKAFGGAFKGKFVVTNVNANNRRKDIATTIRGFADFKQKNPKAEAVLYLHMQPDSIDGWDINVVANDCGLKPHKDYVFPTNLVEMGGYPVDVMNLIYNLSDVVVTTSMAEGWGLSITEAMAVKKPVVAPRHTAIEEICADGRCLLIEPEWNVDVNLGQVDWNLTRHKVKTEDLAAYLTSLYRLRHSDGDAIRRVGRAYEWVKALEWDNVVKKWEELILKQYRLKTVQVKVGRNEKCPHPGCLKKWKHCKKHNPEAV